MAVGEGEALAVEGEDEEVFGARLALWRERVTACNGCCRRRRRGRSEAVNDRRGG